MRLDTPGAGRVVAVGRKQANSSVQQLLPGLLRFGSGGE
jgi:hypothetical protein